MSKGASFIPVLLALAACRSPALGGSPPAPAPERFPFAAAVWRLQDKTDDFEVRPSALDKTPETSLTRSGSPWRPRLSMEALGALVAEETAARVTQDAWPSSDESQVPGVVDLAHGAKLYIGGEVTEATWLRGGADGGTYRLKLHLHAMLARADAPDLDFWEKDLAEDVPHKGRADDDLGAALRRLVGGAVEEMGAAMRKDPAATWLEQMGEQEQLRQERGGGEAK